MKAKKQLLLVVWSLLIIAGFFAWPQNRQWFMKAPAAYWGDFLRQKDRLDLEYRKTRRWKPDYAYSKTIADSFRSKKGEGLILMPPTTYFRKNGLDYHVPEPAVFYYFTGLKTVWANSPKADGANWYVRLQNGKFVIDSVTDRRSFMDTISSFQKLGVSL